MKTKQLDALEAVLLFYTVGPWTEEKHARWQALTQTNEATTRNLCDAVRMSLGMLPSCFGDFTGRFLGAIPADMNLSDEQAAALDILTSQNN